jgi:hypothetical protein
MHQDAWCLLHWKFFAHLCSIERCFSLCCLQVASAWLEDLEAGRLRTFCAWHPKVETADRHVDIPCQEDDVRRIVEDRNGPNTCAAFQNSCSTLVPQHRGSPCWCSLQTTSQKKEDPGGRGAKERSWSYADFGTQKINRFLHFLNDCFAQASDLAAFFEAWPCQSHEFLDLFGFGLVAHVALLWGILACTRGRAEKPWRSIKSCLLLSFNFFFYSECS